MVVWLVADVQFWTRTSAKIKRRGGMLAVFCPMHTSAKLFEGGSGGWYFGC